MAGRLTSLLETAARRFARLATRASVARPGLWRLFRTPMRAQFDRLAGGWEERVGPEALVPLAAALERLDAVPARILDLGTGTGKAARVAARLFPEAEVCGVDLSPAMVAEARKLLPGELAGRVRFEAADASRLPFEDGAFDLVLHLNMLPFFDELARVVAPGGYAVFAFSFGSATPIYVPSATLREGLEHSGFDAFEEVEAGAGSALIARRVAAPGR